MACAPPAQPTTAAAPPAARTDRHPTGFWFFFWGEFAERSSYYGMRAILPLYLTTALALPDTTAGPVYYWFKMGCYLLPLLGGYLADRYFGKYWTIVGFSVPYVLGHFILGIPSTVALAVALVLLAGGSGVIKPNISTLMGLTYDQQRPGQQQLRTAAFLWFYFAINFGSVISMFALPYLRDTYGYTRAFQFPAWLMVGALVIFAAGRRHYAVETPQRRRATPEERRRQWQALRRLLGLFALMVFFWLGYEHNDSLWVFFARDYVELDVPGLDPLPPDLIQVINPLLVLALLPFFNWLFPRIDPDGRVLTATKKIVCGFALAAVSSGVMSAAGYLAEGGGAKVSLAWLVMAYVVLTIGEVLFYGTGLELAYTAAPKNLKGFVTACFLFTVTLANFANSWLSQLYGGSLTDPPHQRGPLSPGEFFGLTALIGAAATVAFAFVGARFARSSAIPSSLTPESL